jgi:hypothetical protein
MNTHKVKAAHTIRDGICTGYQTNRVASNAAHTLELQRPKIV